MDNLGFTFYPKDWWTSDTFFELDTEERYIYLEIIFLMYQNDGYLTLSKEKIETRLRTQIKPKVWEKITYLLTYTDLGYTHKSVKKRRKKSETSKENGKLGGRPPKIKEPNNPVINLPLEKNIIEKNIIEKNIKKENISLPLKRTNNSSNGKQSILNELKNKKYTPLVTKLAEIIVSKKRIKIQPNQIKGWADDIRKLSEIDGIEINRIKKILRWYKSAIGGKFIPVVESGSSFREKFIKLEDAKEREKNEPSKPSNVFHDGLERDYDKNSMQL